jgi:hypothetical protein
MQQRAPEGTMAEQQKAEKKISEKETTKKKVKTEAKAAELSGPEVISTAPVTAQARPATKSLKKGKLPAKNKHRLPRRQKKAQQKTGASL